MRTALALCCPALFLLAASPLAAADGDLDPGFWGDGQIYLSGTGTYEVSAVVVAPDDRVVVVGTRDPDTGGSEWYWRALADSSPGTGSTCYFPLPGGASQGNAYAAAFDRFGRLIVAGSARYGSDRLAVARFSYPDCTLDTSFDGDGYWTLDIPGGLEAVHSLAIDPLGRIALGGYQNDGTDTDLVVALLNLSGGLLTSFSGDGWLTLDPSGAEIDDHVIGVAFDASSRVIAAGSTAYGTNGTNGDWVVARFTLAGVLDRDFRRRWSGAHRFRSRWFDGAQRHALRSGARPQHRQTPPLRLGAIGHRHRARHRATVAGRRARRNVLARRQGPPRARRRADPADRDRRRRPGQGARSRLPRTVRRQHRSAGRAVYRQRLAGQHLLRKRLDDRTVRHRPDDLRRRLRPGHDRTGRKAGRSLAKSSSTPTSTSARARPPDRQPDPGRRLRERRCRPVVGVARISGAVAGRGDGRGRPALRRARRRDAQSPGRRCWAPTAWRCSWASSHCLRSRPPP